ncbi:MAG: hypothetical protein ETSY1_36380 [Candidatus Entotheonella factor]|uniref:Uncharacterized protein n=1 Tax=Entotheonella factor TaxID=1429438 RepID=W4L860_ENTF1|nr:MAG: hypothetical protein ETSY1_36380 [Candidatus Entotheonella factor]
MDTVSSFKKLSEADMPSRAEPLLLPPANPAHNREPSYDEQDIDGYTIAEAHAALEAFKRSRNH